MFRIEDTSAGFTLTMDREPAPRNPRLVEEPLFGFITWGPASERLGDPHAWPDRAAFRTAVGSRDHAIYPLVRLETPKGPVLMRQQEVRDGPAIGYAFASFERICLVLGLDAITPEIRDEVMLDIEARCLGELQALDDFVLGEVYRYAIVDRQGAVVETGRDLYGEDHARHVAKAAFERHLYGVAIDG